MEKPVLAFIFGEGYKGYRGYRLKNVGKGVANNIIVLHSKDGNQPYWGSAMNCYSLGNSDVIDLTWAIGPEELIAVYFDIFNEIHISITKGDQLEIINDSQILADVKRKLLSEANNINILGKEIKEYSQIWNT